MSFDSISTPPPLQHSPSSSSSDPDAASTRETTPGSGVPAYNYSTVNRPDRGKPALHQKKNSLSEPHIQDAFFDSWSSKPTNLDTAASAFFLEPATFDSEDTTSSLFTESPSAAVDLTGGPGFTLAAHSTFDARTNDNDTNMASATPIDIGSRTNSGLSQTSNLTSALRQNGASAMNINGSTSNAFRGGLGRQDSVSGIMPQWASGAMNMMDPNARRESLAGSLMNGSLMNGMSWGGISVGSFIRDDMMMGTGTSPFTLQSPSQHSSSYLPKLEANFMKDFTCCGLTLPSLHDLLQHYEEAHAQKTTQPPSRPQTQQGGVPDSRAALATDAAAAVRQQAQQVNSPMKLGHMQQPQASRNNNQQSMQGGAFGQMQDLTQVSLDMDTVEDMEMDDALGEMDSTPPGTIFTQSNLQGTGGFGQQNQAHAPLGLMQNQQGFRSSQPTTPTATNRQMFSMHGNPTVSSVNTPTLMANPLQQFQTPDSSAPGTPGELDDSMMGGMGDLAMGDQALHLAGLPLNGGMDGNMNTCIDDPAKRLFNPGNGTHNSQQYAQFRLGNAQYGPDSDIAKRIREQQMLAGVPDPSLGMLPHEEPKPFRCPVIGCEKAYKNQNGLKYHKAHGHNTQQLHDNADGTFSIVNPDTSTPYPGTQGMEKEKPYKCDVCGKRYKNLNGLKYHKSHSVPCNPDLPRNAAAGVMHAPNANIAGSGLPGFQ